MGELVLYDGELIWNDASQDKIDGNEFSWFIVIKVVLKWDLIEWTPPWVMIDKTDTIAYGLSNLSTPLFNTLEWLVKLRSF